MPKHVGRPGYKIVAAMAFLRSHMTRGQPYNAGDLLEAAKAAGHAERTVQLAAERLGIEKTATYSKGHGVTAWRWVLPDESDDSSTILRFLPANPPAMSHA